MLSSSSWPLRLFRFWLRAFPPGHRQRFGAEMTLMFQDGMGEQGSARRRCGYLLKALFGLLANGFVLRAQGWRRRNSGFADPPPMRFSPHSKKGLHLMLGSLPTGLRFALRGLMRTPGFALVALFTLTLGIGANTAIFSVLNSVLLRPLPFERPHELVQLWESNPLKGWERNSAAPANFLDWKQQSTVFQDVAAYFGPGFITWSADGEVSQIVRASATGNFFSLLGAKPVAGRLFRDEETWQSENSGAVLSHGFWLRHFGGDPEAVGKNLILNGSPVEIVGVLEAGFRVHDADADIWLPSQWNPQVIGVAVWTRRAHWIRPIARLKPGVTLEQASAELELIAKRLEKEYPETNTQMGAGLTPLHEWVVGESRATLWVLMAAVGAVLLIACANVANLLLARGSARYREMAIRGALGAGRARLFVQMLGESLMLALLGGLLGLGLAWAAVAALKAAAPPDLPRIWDVGIDGNVLLFCLAVALATAVFFGLAPAWSSTRTDLRSALHEGGRQMGSGLGQGRLRGALVTAEVALSLMLVIAAGLLLRSLMELRSVDPGFNPRNLLTFNLSLPGSRYNAAQAVAFCDQLVGRLSGLPGIRLAAAASALPLAGGTWTADSTIEGQEEYVREFRHRSITPEYLETMGVTLVKGRNFLETDVGGSQGVVIINEAFARRFEHAEPLGHRIKLTKPDRDSPWLTVVGVVADEKFERLDEAAPIQVYQPHSQRGERFMRVVLRSDGDPLLLSDTVRAEVAALDPEIAPFSFRSMAQIISNVLAQERFMAQLVGMFAALALLLASVGVYGVLAYSVSRRTQEFGVRMALGAGKADLLGMVLRQGMSTVGLGIVLGMAGAVAFNRILAGVLFQVSTTDPRTFALVAGALAAVALAACYLPAQRACRVDPNAALRTE